MIKVENIYFVAEAHAAQRRGDAPMQFSPLDKWMDDKASTPVKTLYKEMIKCFNKNTVAEKAKAKEIAEKILTQIKTDSAFEHMIDHIANKYLGWRKDAIQMPQVNTKKLPKTKRKKVKKIGKAKVRAASDFHYKKSMKAMEMSVADLAVSYITRDPYSDGSIAGAENPFLTKTRSKEMSVPDEGLGMLMSFANAYSQRYLDLYEAYVALDMQKGIPMLDVESGQMKQHGFTADEIIACKDLGLAKRFVEISDATQEVIETMFAERSVEEREKIFEETMSAITSQGDVSAKNIMQDDAFRKKFLGKFGKTPAEISGLEKALLPQFEAYHKLEQMKTPENQTKNIGLTMMLMSRFAHMTFKQITHQLYSVDRLKTNSYKDTARLEKAFAEAGASKRASIRKKIKASKKKQRLQMEIRHRIGGDGSIQQNSPGTLGQNPLAYLSVLKSGEKGNPIAEFREKMYFVYMSNHFANAVIKTPEDIAAINKWLRVNNKGWQLDNKFIIAMKSRGAQYLPPIFRYGYEAGQNGNLRTPKTHHEVSEFYSQNPNPYLPQVMEQDPHSPAMQDKYFKYPLSKRELLNQTGMLKWDPTDKNRPWSELIFGTGASVFNLPKDSSGLDQNPTTDTGRFQKAYLDFVAEYDIPVWAGISGTLDQSTAMAGLVGLGTSDDPVVRERELQIIKMAYLAFMLPGRDHSVHEIMQSSKSYGLDYVAGPGYEQYLFPEDNQQVKTFLKQAQQKRGSELPGYYRSKAFFKHAGSAVRKMETALTAPAPVAETGRQKINHYIGVSLTAHQFSEDLNKFKEAWHNKPADIEFVQDSDLHMTIGWFESDSEISPRMRELINKHVGEIISSHEMPRFTFESMRYSKYNNLVINMDEEAPRTLTVIRCQIEKALNELRRVHGDDAIPQFNWANGAHVKVGYGTKAHSNLEIARAPGLSNMHKTYTIEKASMMHYDTSRSTAALDSMYQFGR